MRLFISGDEEVAKWHLPLSEQRLEVRVTYKKRGLKQNTFYMNFDDKSATVVSYCYGELNVGISAPPRGGGSKTITEKRIIRVESCILLG